MYCNSLISHSLSYTGDTAAGPADIGALGKAGPRDAHRGYGGSEDSHSPGDTHAHSGYGEM